MPVKLVLPVPFMPSFPVYLLIVVSGTRSHIATHLVLFVLVIVRTNWGDIFNKAEGSIVILFSIIILPAWGEFLPADHINKINALFQRLKRFGYITCNITASDLLKISDLDLFKKISYSGHSL